MKIITNIHFIEGIGQHFLRIVIMILAAYLSNKEFRYSPLKNELLLHNYDNDQSFVDKTESFFNFKDNYPINIDTSLSNYEYYENCNMKPKSLDKWKQYKKCKKIVDNDFETAITSEVMSNIKQKFWEGKKPILDTNDFNICVHIRRTNVVDQNEVYDYRFNDPNEILPDMLYINLINTLLEKYTPPISPKIHIYSQKALDVDSYVKSINNSNVIFHLDTDVFETFQSLAEADVLVISKSGLSYSAALLNENDVYFFPWEFSPCPHWNTIKFKNTCTSKQKETKNHVYI